MKPLPAIVVFGSLILGSYFAGTNLLPLMVDREVLGVVQLSVGAVAAVTSGMLWTTFAKLDQQAPKELTPEGRARLLRKTKRRRTVFWWRVGAATITSLISAVIGGLLKFKAPLPFEHPLFGIGAVTAVLAALLLSLTVHEFSTITKTLRDFPEELAAKKRKTDVLRKLGRTDVK